MNPWVLDAYLENGKRPRRFRNRRLNEICHSLPKKQGIELEVGWVIHGEALVFRMIITWNPQKKQFQYLITNLDGQRYPFHKVHLAYKLPWQVELLFKEWKSYANLHAFDTKDPHIVQGLIWAAIIGAAIKRFLAHATQLAGKVESSTRKVAMCAHHVLRPILHSLKAHSPLGLYSALKAGLHYLAQNALRAHPKRDRQKGRSRLGLEPIIDLDQWVEMANAA